MGRGGFAAQVAAVSGTSSDGYVASVEKAVPLGRWADPSEVAAMVVMLLSDRLGYVTGADLPTIRNAVTLPPRPGSRNRCAGCVR